MILKKLLPLFFIAFSILVTAEEPANKIKFYGFVGNDFFYNSRQNVELTDGLIYLFPKAIELNSNGIDKNDIPQAEMLSVNTRLGIDISGSTLLGAKSSAKIEADFCGASTTYYVLRIRQAYMKLNWEKTELLIGQTWHPLFGTVAPSIPSLNGGAPFQPFNRSPQVRLKYNLSPTLSVTAAAIYQMQYASQGPLTPAPGASASYLKNAVLPDFFLGAECKTKHWTSGAGADIKTIKPDANQITSLSAVAYTQYVNPTFQLKAKAIWGENLSDQLMIGGYGVSKYNSDSTTVMSYTNFNTASAWVNAVYGTKWQGGILLGLSQNFGTNQSLDVRKGVKFTNYGYGFYDINNAQLMLDRLIRIAPHVSYNLPNIKFALEYEFTSANYGTMKSNGLVNNPYTVNNQRIVASMSYFF